MRVRETTLGRRRRVVVTLIILSLVCILVIGAVAVTTLAEPQAATPIQNESQNDTNADEPTGEAVVDERDPSAQMSENESVLTPTVENDTPSSGQQQAVPEAGPQIVQGPEGNVTVAVTENQSIQSGAVSSVALEVANDGDQRASDIVVTMQSADDAVMFGTLAAPQPTRSVAVTELSPGDTETIDVNVASTRVDSGTYPLFASIQYRVPAESSAGDDDRNETAESIESTESTNRDTDETVKTGGPSVVEVNITDAASFDVTPVADEVSVDAESTYEVRIENNDNESLTGVTATIEVGPPLSSESLTAYIGALDPGESETVRFGLESSSDAVETTTSGTLLVSYDAGSGERTNADPVQVPVSIVETDEDTDIDSVAPFAAVTIVFVLAVIWWLRRR